MTTPPDEPIIHTTPAELRALFNQHILPKIQRGELSARVIRESHPSPERAVMPWCTRSQFIRYVDAHHNEVARCHQYRLPDGSIGASGIPDPKSISLNGVLYML